MARYKFYIVLYCIVLYLTLTFKIPLNLFCYSQLNIQSERRKAQNARRHCDDQSSTSDY